MESEQFAVFDLVGMTLFISPRPGCGSAIAAAVIVPLLLVIIFIVLIYVAHKKEWIKVDVQRMRLFKQLQCIFGLPMNCNDLTRVVYSFVVLGIQHTNVPDMYKRPAIDTMNIAGIRWKECVVFHSLYYEFNISYVCFRRTFRGLFGINNPEEKRKETTSENDNDEEGGEVLLFPMYRVVYLKVCFVFDTELQEILTEFCMRTLTIDSWSSIIIGRFLLRD